MFARPALMCNAPKLGSHIRGFLGRAIGGRHAAPLFTISHLLTTGDQQPPLLRDRSSIPRSLTEQQEHVDRHSEHKIVGFIISSGVLLISPGTTLDFAL